MTNKHHTVIFTGILKNCYISPALIALIEKQTGRPINEDPPKLSGEMEDCQ